MSSPKAIVIGSGIAGMAAAIRLAVKGWSVTIFEKNDAPGGKISSFENNGFRFDAGPSLFTQPENIAELFEIAGEEMSDYFEYYTVDTTCTYHYENGRVIRASADPEQLCAEMEKVTGEDPDAVKKYLNRSADLYNNVGNVFLAHSLHKKRTWIHPRILKAIGSVRFPYLFKTLASYNNMALRTEEARQLFNRFATYNGSNPYKAPGMLSLIPHLEQNQGVYFPKGGMISITNTLYRLAIKKGVSFHFNSPVERIIHNEGRARGVVVDNINHTSDIVISNADVYFTFKKMLNFDTYARKILKREGSSSAVIFYWGMNLTSPALGLHNIFFSNNYRKEFQHLFVTRTISDDPTVYVNITSKLNDADAPAGKENWFVMVNAPADSGQDWAILKNRLRANVIDKLNRMLDVKLEELIETEVITSPPDIEAATGSLRGSLYGSSSNSRMAAFLRPPNFSRYVKGLYLCGGSVHPGGGIPLCLNSAKITVDLISRDFKKVYQHS
jgi:phytoene desaturase